ncbi:MAG: site-2 protease family protein [Desulfurococcaceae archaeon]
MPWIYFVIFIAVFWSITNVLYRVIWSRNQNISIKYGVLLVIKKPLKITTSHRLVKLGKVFIALYFAILALSLYIVVGSILTRLTSGVRNIMVLIPGINISGYDLLFFIVAVAIALIIHEAMHAKLASGYGAGVKAFGFALFLFLPIAFIEVDESAFKNAKTSVKIGILSAGVTANFALALAFMMLLAVLSSGQGFMITDVERDSLAEGIGLKRYDIICSVNDMPLSNILVLHDLMSKNSTFEVVLYVWRPGEGYMRISFIKQPWQSKLGVRVLPAPSQHLFSVINQWTWVMIYNLFYWIYLVNLSVAVINALPLYITDGGKIMYEVLGKKMGDIVNIVCLSLFISMILISSTF